MNKSLLCLLLAVATPTYAAGSAKPKAAPPSPLALSCTGCHQPLVNAKEMPALNMLTPAKIAESLLAARDKPKAGSIMARFVTKMSDAQIASLAAELGSTVRP
ncbi:MAG: hypothetical protein M0Q15_07930 [Nevskia sp.]|jgi:cytochrome c553|nr:hypothetical protein [Nevskia sp.]